MAPWLNMIPERNPDNRIAYRGLYYNAPTGEGDFVVTNDGTKYNVVPIGYPAPFVIRGEFVVPK